MSADSIAAATPGLARAPAPVAAAQPADKASAPVAVAPRAAEPLKKAEIDYDPKERAQALQDAIKQLNEQMRRSGRSLEIHVDETLDQPVYTVKDSQSGKVVRQIPDETLLRVAHQLEDVKGLLRDERI